jgi:hypothetical protein
MDHVHKEARGDGAGVDVVQTARDHLHVRGQGDVVVGIVCQRGDIPPGGCTLGTLATGACTCTANRWPPANYSRAGWSAHSGSGSSLSTAKHSRGKWSPRHDCAVLATRAFFA